MSGETAPGEDHDVAGADGIGAGSIPVGCLSRDRDILKLAANRRAKLGIGYMPEDRRLVPQLTVEENVLMPAWAMPHLDQRKADEPCLWSVAGSCYDADRKALLLSGGQQKLVALARAIVAGTDLLLLDEPFEGVAPALSQRLSEVIGVLRGEKLSVLIAQSDSNHLLQVARSSIYHRARRQRGERRRVRMTGYEPVSAGASGAVISYRKRSER